MSRTTRRHFLQFTGSALAAIGFNQLSFLQSAQRYGQVLAQSTPRKLALIVGINNYSSQPLEGCLNDVDLQRNLLIHRFGFNPKDILVLPDAKATREGILTAFEEHLIKQAKPGDVVVYHYSGHGSRIFDPNPIVVEPGKEGLNGTFVPVDGNLPDGYPDVGGSVKDIMGHTLFLLMSALKTENVTVVLDSCFSGGATREARVRSRDGGKNVLVSSDEKTYQEQWLSRLKMSPEDFVRGYRAGVDLGEQQKALEFYNQALPLYQAVGDRGGEATTLNNIGAVYDDLGEKPKALEFYNQALPLSQAVGDRGQEAVTLTNIGLVYNDLGEQQKALEYYNQALPLLQAVGDRGGEATTLTSIGFVYNSWGEKQKALDSFNQALPLLQAVGDRDEEATTLNNIGLVYDSLGEQQKALEFFNQALPLKRAVGDTDGEAVILNNIGAVYEDLGEQQKALKFYNQALSLSQAVGDRGQEAVTLTNIGGVYEDLGEKQQALEFYNQALPLSQAVGDRRVEAVTLNNIGAVYYSLGEKQKALEFFNQALPLSRVVRDRGQEAKTLYNVASLQRSQGNLKQALTLMDSAITIIEDLRTKIGSQELRASYFATVQGYYKFYIDLLMQLHQQNPSQGYDALALHASERARARSLLELLTEANANIRQGVDPKLLEQERTLTQQLNALERRRYELSSSQYTEQQIDAIKQQSQSLLTQLDQLKAQIRVTSPRYADLKYPEPLNLQQIQQQVLDDDTLLLEYSLGEDRSYLWAVTKTSITSYVLPKRSEIEAAAQTFRQSLTPNSAANLETGLPLSQMLLAPVANQLGNKRLLIVGDGALQSVPFAALPIPGNIKMSVSPSSHREINDSLVGAKHLRQYLFNNYWAFVRKCFALPQPQAGRSIRVQKSGSTNKIDRPNADARSSLPLSLTPLQHLCKRGVLPLTNSPTVSLNPRRVADTNQSNSYTPLLVQNEIITLPSASTVAIQRRQLQNRPTAAKKLAVLADPIFALNDPRFSTKPQPTPETPTNSALTRATRNLGLGDSAKVLDRLQYTGTEAKKILALVPEAQRLQALDFNASRTTATDPNLAQYQIIHLATHGLLDPVNPELSGIVLSLYDQKGKSQDGFLRLQDIFNLNLPAELVVLSACETGLGKDVKGEGLVLPVRPFG